LTIQEEEELRHFMKNRKETYDQEFKKLSNGEDNNARDIMLKLARNCKFYLRKADKKLKTLCNEAENMPISLENLVPDFSIDEWKAQLNELKTKVNKGTSLLKEAKKESRKESRNHDNICHLFKTVMEVKISYSLAEERFEDLQLEAFFMGTLDLLNLSTVVGGATPSNSRLANHTLANCLSSTAITPDTALATNPTEMTTHQYKKIVLVFVGFFSVLNTGSNTSRTYTTEQFANWKECCKRIIARWDINGAKNVCLGYNALRMNGDAMDVSWPGSSDCVADKKYSSKTIQAIFG